VFHGRSACFCLHHPRLGARLRRVAKETPCVSTDVCERPVAAWHLPVRHKADDVCYQRQDDRMYSRCASTWIAKGAFSTPIKTKGLVPKGAKP